MARRLRLCAADMPQHVIQRGNNRQACFCGDGDFAAYAHWLREAAQRYGVQVHAWVFMTNHVHLLVTPASERGVSLMMQQLGRQYVRYFNETYDRSGTLWEGRFRSCMVQSSGYLLQCYRYIEMNPVRAAMVQDPAAYQWSSYHTNALGLPSGLLTPHPEYLALGSNREKRLANYRELFRQQLDVEAIAGIRKSVNAGWVIGTESFRDEIESLVKRQVRPGRAGRPRKQESKK